MFDSIKNKRILITGGAGFIASNLLQRLLDLGARSLRATTHRKPPQIHDARIEYIPADLTSRETCERITQDIDYVFMCAANTSGAAVMEKTPLVHVTPNIIMNTLILDASYKAGVEKFLFISSNTVYPATDHPVTETEMLTGDLFEKYFCVGWMKRFTELLCQMYTEKIKKPLQTIVVRPANIYGPYDDFEWETSHVIPALIRKVIERHDPLEVWGDGKELKEFIYIDDFITGMLLAMEQIRGFEPVNIAAGKPVTIREVLQAILEADDYRDANVVYNTSKPTMIPKRLIDTKKAKELLGFEATTSLSEGIKQTVSWYRTIHEAVQGAKR